MLLTASPASAHPSRFRRWATTTLLLALTALLATTAPRPAFAADEPAEDAPSRPLVVVNVASIDRILGDANDIFTSVDRGDIPQIMEGLLGNVNDLKGIKRDQPLGLMLFLKPGLAPRPAPVGFLPVSSIEDLQETTQLGPVIFKKSADAENRYEIIGPNRTLHVLMQHDYAFVAGDAETIDRDFPDPRKLTAPLSARYDIAATVHVDAIPPGMKTLFLGFLQANAASEMERRTDEPEARHRLRQARGERDLKFVTDVLQDGQSLTIGWDASQENKRAVLEVALTAMPDSPLARLLTDIGGKHSRFDPLLSDDAPLSASVSSQLNERDRKMLTESLAVLKTELNRQLAAEADDAAPAESVSDPDAAPAAAPQNPAVGDIVDALNATAKAGHFDGFARFVGEPPGPFVLIGGLRVAQDRQLAHGITEVLKQLQEKSEKLDRLELNADSHHGMAVHRFQLDTPDRRGQRVLGESPILWLAAGHGAAWFAVGGDNALTELKSAIDRVNEAAEERGQREPNAPFRMVMNMSSWLALQGNNPDRPRPGREVAREAFAGGGDRLQIDVRPTETGLRLRFTFDEGFLKMIGLGIARRVDRGGQL